MEEAAPDQAAKRGDVVVVAEKGNQPPPQPAATDSSSSDDGDDNFVKLPGKKARTCRFPPRSPVISAFREEPSSVMFGEVVAVGIDLGSDTRALCIASKTGIRPPSMLYLP